MNCFFVTDLHGRAGHYQKLFALLEKEIPDVLFMGGDIFPAGLGMAASLARSNRKFIEHYLVIQFSILREKIDDNYPVIFLILGNDDGRAEEQLMIETAGSGIWKYIHNRRIKYGKYDIYGYSFVPPSPFLLKDWERYDVSRYVDPGCVSPEEGIYTSPAPERNRKFSTIAKDLENLIGENYRGDSIFLFHAPPYKTNLDRIAINGKMIDHVPIDENVGSIAIRNMIERRQPLITLHGHIHESARLTGSWQDRIGRTFCFSAAHDGPELAVVKFDPTCPEKARRELI
jgi:uncharacterized protein